VRFCRRSGGGYMLHRTKTARCTESTLSAPSPLRGSGQRSWWIAAPAARMEATFGRPLARCVLNARCLLW
jgi:hypothetical protein